MLPVLCGWEMLNMNWNGHVLLSFYGQYLSDVLFQLSIPCKTGRLCIALKKINAG